MQYSQHNLRRKPAPTLPSTGQIVTRVLVSAKSSQDLLAKYEDDLFDIYQQVAHPVKHTATGTAIIGVLDQVSILLSLDFEAAAPYFKIDSPIVPRTYQML